MSDSNVDANTEFRSGRGADELRQELSNYTDVDVPSEATTYREDTTTDGEILDPDAPSPPVQQLVQSDTDRTPAPLRGIDFSQIQTRAQLLKALTVNVPVNEYNLPKFIDRADLLDQHSLSVAVESGVAPGGGGTNAAQWRQAVKDILHAAAVWLEYDQ